MDSRIRTTRVAALAALSVLSHLIASAALAGSHTWDVNEVFSDVTGQIQFIELREANGTPNEVGVPGHTMTSNTKNFVISGSPLASPTSNKLFLMGTAAFAALPGAPTPDAIIPAGVLPFFFSTGGDTVSYTPWDSIAFGTVPTDGTTSLNRSGSVMVSGVNSPTNYAGVSGSVNAAPPPSVPALSSWGPLLLGLLLVGTAVQLALRRRGAPHSA